MIDEKFDSLDEILRGLAAILELTPRISDLVASYGERISSRIVAAAFCELGLDAAHVDAREVIITDSQFQKAVPQDALIEQRAEVKLRPVSYTHLDVYKRQRWLRSCVSAGWREWW